MDQNPLRPEYRRTLIIVLGHFDHTPHLTATGRERLDAAIALLSAHAGLRHSLAVTGCAAGVPRTDEVIAYLRAQHAVDDTEAIELVDSHNTAEDAFLCEPLVSRYSPERLVVVTSDYHVARARYIFEQVFAHLAVEMCPAAHWAAQDELRALLAHEEQALEALRTHGLYRT